ARLLWRQQSARSHDAAVTGRRLVLHQQRGGDLANGAGERERSKVQGGARQVLVFSAQTAVTARGVRISFPEAGPDRVEWGHDVEADGEASDDRSEFLVS